MSEKKKSSEKESAKEKKTKKSKDEEEDETEEEEDDKEKEEEGTDDEEENVDEDNDETDEIDETKVRTNADTKTSELDFNVHDVFKCMSQLFVGAGYLALDKTTGKPIKLKKTDKEGNVKETRHKSRFSCADKSFSHVTGVLQKILQLVVETVDKGSKLKENKMKHITVKHILESVGKNEDLQRFFILALQDYNPKSASSGDIAGFSDDAILHFLNTCCSNVNLSVGADDSEKSANKKDTLKLLHYLVNYTFERVVLTCGKLVEHLNKNRIAPHEVYTACNILFEKELMKEIAAELKRISEKFGFSDPSKKKVVDRGKKGKGKGKKPAKKAKKKDEDDEKPKKSKKKDEDEDEGEEKKKKKKSSK
jgi:hypothetical protein